MNGQGRVEIWGGACAREQKVCILRASGRVRALPEVHLAAARESGRKMSCEDGEVAAGGGLLVGRRWFELKRERRRTCRTAELTRAPCIFHAVAAIGQTKSHSAKVPITGSICPPLAHSSTKPPPTDSRVGRCNVSLSKSLRTTRIM